MRMHDAVPPVFVDGPLLEPADVFMAWLREQGDRLVKLPVTLWLKDHVTHAELGMADTQSHGVLLDDSALGISLHDRLLHLCPQRPARCQVWLSGRLKGSSFHIFAVGHLVTEAEPRAQVEVSS